MAERAIEKASIGDVIRAVSEATGEKVAAMRPRGRHGNTARELAIYLAHRHSGEMDAAIGSELGGIAATNVSYASRKVQKRLRDDPKLRKICTECEQNLLSER